MRIKLVLLLLCMGLLCTAALVPTAVRAAVVPANYVRAATRGYAAEIQCSGVIEQQGKKQVFLSTPVIAQSVLVAPGTFVQEGQVLARIDTEQTRTVLSQSVLVQKEPDKTAAGQVDLEKISQAAALYGVTPEELAPLLGGTAASLAGAIEKVEEKPDSEIIAVPQEILAPQDGMVTEVALESGVLTQATGSIFTIADKDSYFFRAAIGEKQIADVKVGDEVSITCAALEDRLFTGVVVSIAPVARRATAPGTPGQATVEVQVEILDPDGQLKNDYSASAKIMSQDTAQLVTLPYEAIRQDENNVEYVLVYHAGRTMKKPVLTGKELASCVEIREGIDETDLVLMGSALEEGMRVRLGEESIL